MENCSGSRKIIGNKYSKPIGCNCSNESEPVPYVKQLRQHRRNRKHKRVRKEVTNYVRTDEDLACQSENVVYLIICTLHENCWYIGSSDNVRRRWTKHKFDWKHSNRTCMLASHGQDVAHPVDPEFKYLTVLPIDSVKNKKSLLRAEVWW